MNGPACASAPGRPDAVRPSTPAPAHTHLTRQSLDDGEDSAALVGGGHGICPGTGGLAADIEDVGAGLDHRQPGGNGTGRVGVQAAVGERVRCDVEDAHDERVLPQMESTAVGQGDQVVPAGHAGG